MYGLFLNNSHESITCLSLSLFLLEKWITIHSSTFLERNTSCETDKLNRLTTENSLCITSPDMLGTCQTLCNLCLFTIHLRELIIHCFKVNRNSEGTSVGSKHLLYFEDFSPGFAAYFTVLQTICNFPVMHISPSQQNIETASIWKEELLCEQQQTYFLRLKYSNQSQCPLSGPQSCITSTFKIFDEVTKHLQIDATLHLLCTNTKEADF